MRQLTIISLAIFMAVMAGCATVPDASKAYLLADDQFVSLQDQYIAAFKNADPQTQAKWREDITPKMLEASKYLDEWKMALAIGDDPAQQIALYNRLYRILLHQIVEVDNGTN
jgi:hypothetical protein